MSLEKLYKKVQTNLMNARIERTLIINKQNEWDHSLGLNDVSLAKLLNEHNIPLKIGYRQDFKSYPKIKEINSNNYHYGFRLDTSGIPRFLIAS